MLTGTCQTVKLNRTFSGTRCDLYTIVFISLSLSFVSFQYSIQLIITASILRETLYKYSRKNRKVRILSQSHCAEKLEMRPIGDKKIKKSCTVPKTQRGDPIVSSGFLSYDKNGVTEKEDPLHHPKCAPWLPVQ